MLPQVPVDNPALHQGRKRTTPHVEGQWAAYVYVPLRISKRSSLFRTLLRMYSSAKETVSSLHPIGFTETDLTISSPEHDAQFVELHISLSRPVYLRAHQRDEFKRAVQKVAKAQHRYAGPFFAL